MLICDTQFFTSPNYDIDCSVESKALHIYPLGKIDEGMRGTELRERYSSFSTDSDSCVSQSCYKPSTSESEQWECVAGVEAEDDVFTEKEIVLSYEGLEITDSISTCDMENSCVDTSETDLDINYIEKFTHELDEEDSSMSLTSDIQLPLNDINSDSKNININDICLDSFLKWLDNDSNEESTEDFTDTSDDLEYLENSEDSNEFKPEQSQQVFFPSNLDDYNYKSKNDQLIHKLPPIQTMIPAGSRIIRSFPSEKCVQPHDSINTLIRGSPISLHLDILVSN